MIPPYVVFIGAGGGGVSGGNGGPFFNVAYTVVDSTNACVPDLPALWTDVLATTDTESSLQTRIQTNLAAFLLANYGLPTGQLSFTWLS